MKYATYNTFKYLENDFDKDFTSLDEIRLHNILKESAKKRPVPLLTRWLNNAKNIKFKLFLIYEIGYFKQKECGPYLLELYKVPGQQPQLKIAIATALAKLDYKEAIPVIIEDFNYLPGIVHTPMIHALGGFGGEEVIEFFNKFYLESHSRETRIEVIKNLYYIDKSRNTFNTLKNNTNSNFEKKIFAYIEKNKEELPIYNLNNTLRNIKFELSLG